MENIDKEMPKLKKGENLCSLCWAVGFNLPPGWVYLTFNHLAAVWLCPKCINKKAADLVKLQQAGL